MKRIRAFTLLEIMMVVVFIGFLLAIAVPAFLRARERTRMRACQENMLKIAGAIQQYSLENNLSGDEDMGAGWPGNLTSGDAPYLRYLPECKAGGQYILHTANTNPPVECSIGNRPLYPHITPVLVVQ